MTEPALISCEFFHKIFEKSDKESNNKISDGSAIYIPEAERKKKHQKCENEKDHDLDTSELRDC